MKLRQELTDPTAYDAHPHRDARSSDSHIIGIGRRRFQHLDHAPNTSAKKRQRKQGPTSLLAA